MSRHRDRVSVVPSLYVTKVVEKTRASQMHMPDLSSPPPLEGFARASILAIASEAQVQVEYISFYYAIMDMYRYML
jgi:hypothetical protein